MNRLPAFAALALFGLGGCSSGANTAEFARVENARFVIPYASSYFVGANFWYGALLAAEGPNADRDRLCRELDRMKRSGITNLRILVGSEGSEGVVSKVEPILQTAPGIYNEKALDGLDFLLAELGKRRMYAVLYLTNSWEWSGGYSQYLEWSGCGTYPVPGRDGWETFLEYVSQYHQRELTDRCKQLFFDHVRRIVTRTNRYTGRPYTEDPAIFSWQIANEPRAFTEDNKERFFEWIEATARLLKELDPNHMVSTGSEGANGCEGDLGLWERIHAIPEIDYANIHIWPYNWGWIQRESVAGACDTACRNALDYIDRHAAVAQRLGKPLVIEEFGYPRDGFSFAPGSPTLSRDRFYRTIFSRLLRDAARGGIIAGCNFWGWGGYAKPAHLRWQQGDDYCGDPAQEEQGLNSVFASDTTTLREIAQANRTLQLHAASSACGSGNRNPAEVLRTLRAAAASGRFFFGQQDYPFYGVSWSYEPERSDVSDVCGDRPAVLGCELGELELAKGRNLDGVPFETMRRMIVDHHRHEGLVTLSWHPRNPLTGGDAWDVSQRNVVHEVLPGGSCHDRFMGWLDDVAAFITSLRTAEGETIPVLFRPWHEHTGSWFWWGEDLCTSDEYKELWRMTVDRLRMRGAQIVTVYSPNPCMSSSEYLERWPGDAWVDVLGLDAYDGDGSERFVSGLNRSLAVMDSLSRDTGKPYAVSETGREGIPEAKWWSGSLLRGIGTYTPSYVLVWRNAPDDAKPGHFYAPWPGQVSEEDFLRFHADARTLFLRDGLPAEESR